MGDPYKKRVRSEHAHQPVAPQSLVVRNAAVSRNLYAERSQEPRARFPLYSGQVDLDIRREDWAFTLTDGRSAFAGRKNASDVVAFTSASGLTGEEAVAFVGCVDSEPGRPQNDGSAMPELGFAIRSVGPCTGTNTGSGKIFAGDAVIWDWPDTYTDEGGKLRPLFTSRAHPTRFVFATRRMRYTDPAACVLAFVNQVVEQGFSAPDRAGAGYPLVHTLLREAYEAHKLFDHIAPGADPLERIVVCFESHFPELRTNQLRDQYQTATADELRADAGVWQRVMRAIVMRGKGQEILDAVCQRPETVLFDPDSPHPFAALAFGIPYVVQELVNLYHARLMGTALSDAPAGGQLDLIMH